MKLITKIRNTGLRLREAFSPRIKALSPATQSFLRGNDDEELGAPPFLNPYQQSAWVYAAVSAKASKLAQVPFRFSTSSRGGETGLNSGPLHNLFQQPHPHLDRFAFWELISTWLDLRGEAFLVALDADGHVVRLGRPGGFPVRQLVVLPPDSMREVLDAHTLSGWRHQAAGTHAPLDSFLLLPEEVIHVKLPNPFNYWRGLPPLGVAWLAAQTDYLAAQLMKGLIQNNADTGLVLTTKTVFTNEQREQILAILRERKRRAGVADRPLFLGHDIQVQKPMLNAADLQFLENRKFSRQEIGSIFKVPQTILGYTEDANRSVDEQQSANWIHNVITPLCRRLEAAFQPLVTMEGSGVSGWFDTDALPEMQAARRGRVDTALKLASLGVPFNDINRELDLGFPERG